MQCIQYGITWFLANTYNTWAFWRWHINLQSYNTNNSAYIGGVA